jgi:FkbM family methyltransferase
MSEFHSQYGQDKMLHETIFKGFKGGVFVDVGANDGVSLNNTLFFERDLGWTGVNVEPIPTVFEKLSKSRPKCININCAVSSKEGTADFIMNNGYTEMLSGLASDFDQRHLARLNFENSHNGGDTKIVPVQTRRLDTILRENNITRVHYLSIDVEGGEFQVIKSINFDEVKIDVIGFEDAYPDVGVSIVKFLEEKGYQKIGKTGDDIFMVHAASPFLPKNKTPRLLSYLKFP